MTTRPADIKAALAGYRAATATFEADAVRSALETSFADDAELNLCHPFGTLTGPQALFDTCFAPLHAALPDLERRDMIVMAGTTPEGQDWVGCMGNYMGTMTAPWVIDGHSIPSTGHLTHMRYHEFLRIEGDNVVEAQIIWDIPEVLRSGDHGKVARWRLAKAIERTARERPDLLEARGGLSSAEQQAIAEFGIELAQP